MCCISAVCYTCYGFQVAIRHISHRELRNESGRILRQVQEGEAFIVTNNGEPVALLQPIGHSRLAGIRHQPRVPGARFCDVIPEQGLTDESALESLLLLRGER